MGLGPRGVRSLWDGRSEGAVRKAKCGHLKRRAPVAQRIERRFPKPCVAGSSPAGGADQSSDAQGGRALKSGPNGDTHPTPVGRCGSGPVTVGRRTGRFGDTNLSARLARVTTSSPTRAYHPRVRSWTAVAYFVHPVPSVRRPACRIAGCTDPAGAGGLCVPHGAIQGRIRAAMSESAGASRAGVVLPVLPVAEHPAWH